MMGLAAFGWRMIGRVSPVTRSVTSPVMLAAILLAAILLAGAVTGRPALAAPPLRVAIEGSYPPFSTIDGDGHPRGFDVDIADALCRTLEWECVFVVRTWDHIIDGLLAGDYDAVVASMSVTEERKRRVAFTNRYYSTPLRFIGRHDLGGRPGPGGRQDLGHGNRDSILRDRRLGAIAGTTSGTYLQDHFGSTSTVVIYDTQDELLTALTSGQVDAILGDSIAHWAFLQTPGGRGFKFVGDSIFVNSDVAIAVRPGDSALRERLNQALARILIDGSYEAVNSRYFPFSIY